MSFFNNISYPQYMLCTSMDYDYLVKKESDSVDINDVPGVEATKETEFFNTEKDWFDYTMHCNRKFIAENELQKDS